MEKSKDTTELISERDKRILDILAKGKTPLLPIEVEWMQQRVDELGFTQSQLPDKNIPERDELENLKRELFKPEVVDYPPLNKFEATLGSQVRIEFEPGDEETYILVGRTLDKLGDLQTARITDGLGRALLDAKAKAGDTVSYVIKSDHGNSTVSIKILNIEQVG